MITKSDKRLIMLVHIGIGALLLYAAWTKLGEIPMFALVLKRGVPGMGGLSTPQLFHLANAVVFVEVFIGLALILHLRPALTRWAAVALFAVFSGVLASMLVREVPMSCGCLGLSPSGWSGHGEHAFGLARNAFLIALLFVVDRHAKNTMSSPGESREPAPAV